jgi:hypothetical protein
MTDRELSDMDEDEYMAEMDRPDGPGKEATSDGDE